MLNFICPLIVVEDVATSRKFYEELLGQRVKFDLGENVTFEGDFALHQQAHFQQLLGEAEYPVTKRAHNGELYFESDEVEELDRRLEQADVEFVHRMREQPWGQRVVRVYDPDGHIVEIGETMEAVVWRFHRQGMAVEEISAQSSMPREFVEHVLQTHAES
jgi:catechol 2,3-dioxygenase-like lactoylglutathione lyase family enzyme